MPQITVEAKNIWQDRVQKRVNELTEDVGMSQIPEEPDEATLLIPLKRFCVQIVDVPVTRVQEHALRRCRGGHPSTAFPTANVTQIGKSSIVMSRNIRGTVRSTMLLLATSRKARAKSRRGTCLHACGTNEPAEGGKVFFKRASASACSGSHHVRLRG